MLRYRLPAVAGLLAVFAAPAALAQGLSAEEITARLNGQLEAIKRTQNPEKTRSVLGGSRGVKVLVLEGDEVTEVDGAGATDALVTIAETSGEDTLRPLTPSAEAKPIAHPVFDDGIAINLQIKFGFDSAVISPSEKPKLETLCQGMQGSAVSQFRVVGHTDGTGSDAYNEKLSVLRAEEVARYLISDCGIPASRLQAVGFGERFLLNNTDERAPENRRVEFQALG